MSDPRSLNPLVFNFQKLGLELKCPLCLNVLNKPMLLPCNHIFCNGCIPRSSQFTAECPSCHRHFTDREIRPATHMDSIIAIYKDLDATFSSTLLPVLSADTRTPISISTSAGQLRVELGEIAPKDKHPDMSCQDEIELLNKTETCGELKDGVCEQLERQSECGLASKEDQISPLYPSPVQKNVANFCSVSEELEVNHASELSPGSSLSDGGDEYAEGSNTYPGSRNVCKEKSLSKSRTGDSLVTPAEEVACKCNPKDTFHNGESKRQKKLNYQSSDAVIWANEYNNDTVSQLDNAAVINGNLKSKYEEHNSVMSSSVPSVASFMSGSTCAFCHSSEITDGSGPMLHYADGKEVASGETTLTNVVHVHQKCIEWAPQVYFVGDIIKNLDSELLRAAKLKCSCCGVKGAALGCFAKSCCRSYHVPCAAKTPDCRWAYDDFLMLCPVHRYFKFPSEKPKSRKRDRGDKKYEATQRAMEQSFWALCPDGPKEWVLCGSALSSKEKCLMKKFASISGAQVCKSWKPNVTHVIASTDEEGACSRTLKFLMAILNGRWVLNVDWVKSCMDAKYPVDEEHYEVELDNHGVLNGPRTGRLRALNDDPKLFVGLRFYFHGNFVPAYKSDLSELVADGGGIVAGSWEHIAAQRQGSEEISTGFVVYNSQDANPTGFTWAAEASDLAKDNNARAIPHTWILESIAAHRLLPY